MKALIKGGIFLALGWLASNSGADEIQWKASAPKPGDTGAVVPAQPTTGARAIIVGQPTPLDGFAERPPASFRPISDAAGAIIRGQSDDDKTVAPLPKLEIYVGDTGQPKPLPKDKTFTPPPPTPIGGTPTPSPVFDSLGITGIATDGCCGCGDVCGSRYGGRAPVNFGGCDCCADRGAWWVSAEYLMWFLKGQTTPPLITAGPNGVPNGPALGNPGTTVLYNSVPDPMRSGGRFDLGYWFNRCPNLGIEVSAFFLGRVTSTETFTNNGTYQLGRPFNETATNGAFTPGPSAEIFTGVGPAGPQTGYASIHTYSQLYGIEGNLRYKLCCGPNYWLDLIGGYRHLNLSEGIDITESTGLTAPGNITFVEQESFHTRNEFNGAQIGLDGEVRLWNRFFFGGTGKIAMGNVYQIVNIDGTTTAAIPGIGSSTQQGALLATPTNIGRFTQNRFGVMPEVGLKIGYDVTDHLRVFVGYDFMYLNTVVRPGDQIDQNVNSNNRPLVGITPAGGVGLVAGPGGGGPAQPAVLMRTTDFWAQGVNFGLIYRY